MTPPNRPQVLITREGWYYVFVVLFIIGGSVLREVNLLVALAGVMASPLLFNWRIVYRSMRRLSARRDLPLRCEAGRPIRVRLTLRNESSSPCWMLTAHDLIRKSGSRERQFAEVWLPRLPARGTASAAYRMVLTERGKYRIGPLRIVCRFPFGLIRATVVVRPRSQLIVWPRIGMLTDRWRSMLDGDRIGAQHARSKRGSDGEFFALRPFAAGDSMRMIHWRSTAKAREPMVRQTERLQLPELTIIIDPYVGSETAEDSERLELLLRMAATMILDICRDSGGSVTVTLAGPAPETFRAAPSRRFAEQLLDRLALAEGQSDPSLAAAAVAEAWQRSPTTVPLVLSTRSQAAAGVAAARGPRPRWIDVSAGVEELYRDPPARLAHRDLLRAVEGAEDAERLAAATPGRGAQSTARRSPAARAQAPSPSQPSVRPAAPLPPNAGQEDLHARH